MPQFYGQTVIHPAGLAVLAVLCIVLFTCSRKWAVAPFLVACCFIAPAQRLVLAGLDFDVPRILVLVGLLRVTLRGEFKGFRWRIVDGLIIAYLCANTLAYIGLYGTGGAIVNRLGQVIDIAGTYFVFRALVRDWSDVDRFVRTLVMLSVPVLVLFLVERATGRNLFAALGGVPAITEVRAGRMRCQGAFAHSIIAGCFFASTLPFLAGWVLSRRSPGRFLAIAGCVIALALVVLTASSTPVMAVIFAGVAFLFYPLHRSMRAVRWTIFLGLLGLHIFMKAPVWSLIGRIDIVSGSTGWHRFSLIDAFINRWSDWAFVGTIRTDHWGPGLGDVTNQYVLEGVRGGILSLALFIAIIAFTFRGVGVLMKRAANNRVRRMSAWTLGVTLFVHLTSFLAVSYFGQVTILWYLLLATVASLEALPAEKPVSVRSRTTPSPIRGAARLRAIAMRAGPR